MDRSRYFLIRFAEKPGNVEKKPASIEGIHVDMTGLKHILWYQIAKFCLQSTFDISVLAEKCDGLVCWWMGTLVVPRGSMYKFFVRVEFSDEDWFSSFSVYGSG